MYQQGFCSRICMEHAKNLQHSNACVPRCPPFMIEYPSAYCSNVPNFNKHVFPKQKYDSGCLPPRKKPRKKRCNTRKAKSDDCMLRLCNGLQRAKQQIPCCTPNNCSKDTTNNCCKDTASDADPVEETCTQFMELVQGAVQETIEKCAKSTMDDIYEKISCKMDEVACQMKELKEDISNIALKNDLRFKCICEFLFAHLQTGPKERATRSQNKGKQQQADCKDKRPKQLKYCSDSPARLSDYPTKVRDSDPPARLSDYSKKVRDSDFSARLFDYPKKVRDSDFSARLSDYPKKVRDSDVICCCRNCSRLARKENLSVNETQSDMTENSNGSDQSFVENNSEESQSSNETCKKLKELVCCENKMRRESSSTRNSGGMNRMGTIKRWTASDYKPSPKLRQILSKHCSRIDTLSKHSSTQTKSSFPEIIIDQMDSNATQSTISSPEHTNDVDTQENSALSDKTLCN